MSNFFQELILPSIGWAVLSNIWQMALLWVVYQLLFIIFSDSRPAVRSKAATFFIVVGFLWFIFTFISSLSSFGKSEPFFFQSTKFQALSADWIKTILPYLSLGYFLFLIFPILQFIRNYRYVLVIKKYGLSKINVDWKVYINTTATIVGISKNVRIWVSEFVVSPVTIGYLKPIILVPLAAINHLTPQQLEAVLLHELAHIKRHDYLINLILNIIHTVLYFNPFVKYFVNSIEKDREISCDEMVMQFQYNAHDYASALLLLERSSYQQRILALSINGKKVNLSERIELIVGFNKKKSSLKIKIAGIVVALTCIFSLNFLISPIKKYDIKRTYTYSPGYSSFTFIDDNKDLLTTEPAITKNKANNLTADNKIKPDPIGKKTEQTISETAITPTLSTVGYSLAGFDASPVPILKKYQEKQIDEAVLASKKVFESSQWTIIEKNIADALTPYEINILKTGFDKEISQLNWNVLENNLRKAYTSIDWENVSTKMAIAMEQIKTDSLLKFYADANAALAKIKSNLIEHEVKSIPDTDINLKMIEENKNKIQESIKVLKAMKAKKIIRL